MSENELYAHPTLAGIYDVTCGWSQDRDFYLNLVNGANQSILDIGCGTGLLCRAYASKGNRVVGLDPSEAMLTVARDTSKAYAINYIYSTVNNAGTAHPELIDSFDLIVMTGHAFQCLTTKSAVVDLFSQVRKWLKVGGRFVFESRNPSIDWISRWHGATRSYDSAFGRFHMNTQVTKHSMLGQSIDTITYEHSFVFDHETLSGSDTLWFMQKSDIVVLLHRAGLGPVSVYGDWSGNSFESAQSDEMIFDTSKH